MPDFREVLPMNAEIIRVAEQNGRPQMWAIVPVIPINSGFAPSKDQLTMQMRNFFVIATGQGVDDRWTYIASWEQKLGGFIWHLFEAK